MDAAEPPPTAGHVHHVSAVEEDLRGPHTGSTVVQTCGDPTYHCMCSMQVVDITLMKDRLTSITSIRVVQQKHRRSTVCL
jgi:hypothetical protein